MVGLELGLVVETVQRSIVRSSFDRSLVDKMYLYANLDRKKYLKFNECGSVNKMERAMAGIRFKKIHYHPNRA